MKNYSNSNKYTSNNYNNRKHLNQFSTTTTSTTTIVQKKPDTNNIVEFPTLSGGSNVEQFANTTLDFKTASLKERQKEKKEELNPGWTSFAFEDGKLKKAGYQKECYEEPFSVKAKRIISIMVECCDRYKENYIELYGEDTYHKMYSFPRGVQEEDESCTENEKGENEDENEDPHDDYDDYY